MDREVSGSQLPRLERRERTTSGSCALPPSGRAARRLAAAALVLPVLLPVAVVYARRARRQTRVSPASFAPLSLMDRPVILYLVVTITVYVVMFVLMGVMSIVFGVSPV